MEDTVPGIYTPMWWLTTVVAGVIASVLGAYLKNSFNVWKDHWRDRITQKSQEIEDARAAELIKLSQSETYRLAKLSRISRYQAQSSFFLLTGACLFLIGDSLDVFHQLAKNMEVLAPFLLEEGTSFAIRSWLKMVLYGLGLSCISFGLRAYLVSLRHHDELVSACEKDRVQF